MDDYEERRVASRRGACHMAHYELKREEIAELDRPVKGIGGFEGLI